MKNKIINIANALSVVRILVIPLIIIFEFEQSVLFAFFFIVSAGLLDILDGHLARLFNTVSNLGAALDIAADFSVITGVFIVLVLKGIVPFYLLLFICICFFTFCAYSIITRKICKSRLGRFAGTVCFGGIIIIYLLRILDINLDIPIMDVIAVLISGYLFLSTMESFYNVLKFYRQKSK